jgi:hypothetical protein
MLYLPGPGRVKKADVRRYGREGKKSSLQNALGSGMSKGNDGEFRFQDAVLGEDWVVVFVGRKKFKRSVENAETH